ncbi:MAG: T9SS type A sorting domain-containing protein [Saprospiraceae bacterium]|nr:T9SS type A sorting domain-containing protein [Saprospiraceae bacterium]MCF8251856.1 T9SS type A sorting domain-containing protein [Saprospiraceae bacterium]MCF8313533.1 T9SS type A sorting domain-containing protein [Saprospiraceae bacterium]MCF8442604.1 T9SS type A sorting domain-containing protein [Saprospiraceae bacterium]
MKKYYAVIAFVVSTIWLHAQITVTSSTFPAVGDTLKTATDLDPDGVTITPPGGPATWDFTGLAATSKSETTFQAASEGSAFADFPNAELVTIGAGGQGETYFDISATSFNNLGFYGSDPTGGLPIQTAFKFSPPVPERRAPLNFIDNSLAETSLNITLPIDSALGAILAQLGVPAGLADSLRIRVTASRNDLVDAYGSLTIPGGTYDVLREKSIEYRSTSLDIRLFGLWIDVTAQAGAGSGLGKDTTIAYNFISNTEKEYIAIVEMDNANSVVQQVEYKDNNVISGNNDMVAAKPEVLVSPNPTANLAVFELKNFALGNYSLRLLDAQGMVVLVTKVGLGAESVSLESLGKGTYFYQVLDEKNRVQATGKLLKINE